ncbi:tripartite tricarboxylate transporter permease [Oceanispirochaeta sp.]|jgi:putative tricarboxylic transport membrane protein|uniref:tripartite tricarboxylate transporter permease n=1 Tax=Oceanispirochaeta sp. TaxID=2035350 RepID=UPI00262A9E05|nr:tripartite tricarboxylate transporter permease [Oceanispirochaeta sp.]MDA3958200.1 tripartite tricarboxylate transporter permease [Oceanispirochaeta sp.]
MFDGILMFLASLGGFFSFKVIFIVLWSTQLGIIVGMLPGLTATMGVALMTTLTYKMPADTAVLILMCMYIGAIYGGSRSAILLNIPGTPANAATSVDGHPLALQGKAGEAIGIATTGSFLGSIIGMFMLAFFTPILGNFALDFQSYEFFWLAIFGIIISGNLTAPKDPLKGWIAGFIGLFIAMIGMEGIHAHIRYSFGNVNLSGGIDLLPAMVGAFGMAEILNLMKSPRSVVINTPIKNVFPHPRQVLKYWKTILRSGVIGTFVGAIPGVGEDIAAWVSYDFAKRGSKEKKLFGKGSIEGLIASETGNNAAAAGAVIPVLSLAIPGSAPAAVLLAAMFIHGIRPGPLIMIESPEFVYKVVAMVFMATCAMMILGLSMVKSLVKVLQVPRTKLIPVIFTLCVMGSYALASRTFDVKVMIFFGILGYLMREMDYPVAPMILGIILGGILDKNLRRALVLSDGSFLPFVSRPICLVLIFLTIFAIIGRTVWFGKLKKQAFQMIFKKKEV